MVSVGLLTPTVTFYGGGLIGHIEVWMDHRVPHYGTNNPQANPGSFAWPWVEARIVSPERSAYVRGWDYIRGTDPEKQREFEDWPDTEWEHDADEGGPIDVTHNMPSQEIFDEAIMTAAGHFRIYPFGVTGGNVNQSIIAGATNFLVNWGEVGKPEFLGVSADTPRHEWPPLEIELYGSVSAQLDRQYTVKIRFKLLGTTQLDKLNRQEPGWLEFAYGDEVAVIKESLQVTRSFSKHYGFLDTIESARQPIGKLRYKWVSDEFDPDDPSKPTDPNEIMVEILEP